MNKIKDWIKNNHKWFFSGLGVFIFTIIIGIFRWFYKESEIFSELYWNESIVFTRSQRLLTISLSVILTCGILYILIRRKMRVQEIKIENLVSKDTFLDDLVQVPNAKALEHKFLEAVNLSKDKNTPLSLMLIDIDNFKRFNDEFSYDTGNYILQQFIKLIKSNVRNTDDSIIRYQNGDEFIIIATKTTSRNVELFSERIRKLVFEEAFKLLDTNRTDSISVSIGATEVDLKRDSLKGVELRLEEALKFAKKSGKNRTELMNYEA